MSVLYNFLTRDPEPRGCEDSRDYHKRRIRRLRVQRLIIQSFPREFQALDEAIFRGEHRKVGSGDKDGLVAASISTFTGRDRLVAAMLVPIRERTGRLAPPENKDELKALRWVKGGRWAELDSPA